MSEQLIIEMLQKQSDKLEPILKSIDRFMVKQELINDTNGKEFKDIHSKIKENNHLFKKIKDDYVSKGSFKKLIIATGSFLIVVFAGYSSFDIYNENIAEQVLKASVAREEYALSIASPKQAEEIIRLRSIIKKQNIS